LDLVGRRPWSALIEAMGSGLVVVVKELSEDGFQVAPAQDQDVVEKLSAAGADKSLRI